MRLYSVHANMYWEDEDHASTPLRKSEHKYVFAKDETHAQQIVARHVYTNPEYQHPTRFIKDVTTGDIRPLRMKIVYYRTDDISDQYVSD